MSKLNFNTAKLDSEPPHPIVAMAVIACGIGRLLIEPRFDLPTATGSYEAFAHLFVGGLFGAWLVGRKNFYLSAAIVLSLMELVMFLIQRAA